MCGIVGGFGKISNNFNKKVKEGLGIINHRGPDNQSCIDFTNGTFGHVRLSIVDLNTRSNQPIVDPKTGNILVFNGEIYNFLELKSKYLKSREFSTKSDTEVLLYLLSDYPLDEIINQLNGMFAFAFFDFSKQELFLSRDRFGKKPLFYYIKDEIVFFSSEIKAFKPFNISLIPNKKSIINFLHERTLGSYSDTFFKNIFQIESGHIVRFKYFNNLLTRYDSTFFSFPSNNISISYEAAKEKFLEMFNNSLKRRVPKEVPYAITLSGGLDSSAIASVLAKQTSNDITVVSAVYPGDKGDESDYANMVINKYENLKSVFIEIKPSMFMEVIDDVIYTQETPIADGSMIAHYLLMQEIKKLGIKVVLSGNGGDEVLAGYYKTFFPAYNVEALKKFSLKLNYDLLSTTFYHLLPYKLKNIIKKYFSFRLNFLYSHKDILLLNDRYNDSNHSDLINSYLIQSLTHWSSPGFLLYEDRNTMRHSIEGRAPFFDVDLVSFLLSLQADYKIDSSFTKKILRDTMKNIIPEPIRIRQDKQGFHAPIDKWEKEIDFSFIENKEFLHCFNYLNVGKIMKSSFIYRWRLYAIYKWYKIFIYEKN